MHIDSLKTKRKCYSGNEDTNILFYFNVLNLFFCKAHLNISVSFFVYKEYLQTIKVVCRPTEQYKIQCKKTFKIIWIQNHFSYKLLFLSMENCLFRFIKKYEFGGEICQSNSKK